MKILIITIILTLTNICEGYSKNPQNLQPYITQLSLGGASFGSGKTPEEAYVNALKKMPPSAKIIRVSRDQRGILYTCSIYWEK